MSFKPYPKQQEAIDKMVEFVNSKSNKKGLFIYPTSFGKSVIIANVASKFPDSYFINVTTSKELVKQNYEKFCSYGYEADICSASLGERNVGKITFATIGTLTKQVNFFKNKKVVILADESHVGSKKGSQLDKFLKQIPNSKLIGTTATPLRLKQTMNGTELKMMNRDRDCIYTSIEHVVQIQDVVKNNQWTELIYDIKDIDESNLQLNTTGTDYTLESLKAFSDENEIPKKCIEEVEKLLAEGRKSILIFVPFINDALEIEKQLDVCKAVYSGMDSKERDNIIDDFKKLKLKVIAQVNILSYGFDHPELDAIIFARPTNSITIWYQGLGRGVRKHPFKKDCKVIDISGNYNNFGKIEDISYEEDKAYGGWAAFSGDRLLTNYPLNKEVVPTKQSLKDAFNRKKEFENEDYSKIKFTFGKYKDKTVGEVFKEPSGKQYMAWLIEPKTNFNFYGEQGKKLKDSIYKQLKISREPTKVKYEPVKLTGTLEKSEYEIVHEHINKLKNITDLNGIF